MTITLIKNNPSPAAPLRESGYLSGTYTAATVTNADMTTTNSDATNGAVVAAGVLTITPGFRPKYVKVINVTDRLTQEWFEGMNSGDFIETAANGVRTLETDDKLVVGSDDTGSAPVTIQGNGTVTITFDGGAVTDNDTMVWLIEG